MIRYTLLFSLLVIGSLFFVSCEKDQEIKPTPKIETPVAAGKTSAVFNFKALADNLPLIANTKWYVNANGDSFTVSRFNYYISNVKLKREDGIIFYEPESYHVIKHIEGARSFTVSGIPEGEYDQIEFTIGVDADRNISGAQTGDLSPDSLMFWTWSTGYIFFKLEGDYKTTSSMAGATYAMHVGGFEGKDNCIRSRTFNLTTKLSIKKNKQPKIFYDANINTVFSDPTVISLDAYFVIASGQHSKTLANNYTNMFVLNHIEN